jgi:hypothetical protein
VGLERLGILESIKVKHMMEDDDYHKRDSYGEFIVLRW